MIAKRENMVEVVSGTVCLILALALIFLSIYIIPYLLWTLPYSIPTFIMQGLTYFQDTLNYSYATSGFIIWMLLFIPGVISGVISYYITRDLDQRMQIVPQEEIELQREAVRATRKRRQDSHFGLKIFGLLVVLTLVVLFVKMFIKATF